MHAARLVVPRGWDVVRLPPDPAQERADDLEALANVVREVGSRAGASRVQAQPLRPRPGRSHGASGRAAASAPSPSRSARASRSAAAATCGCRGPPRLPAPEA